MSDPKFFDAGINLDTATGNTTGSPDFFTTGVRLGKEETKMTSIFRDLRYAMSAGGGGAEVLATAKGIGLLKNLGVEVDDGNYLDTVKNLVGAMQTHEGLNPVTATKQVQAWFDWRDKSNYYGERIVDAMRSGRPADPADLKGYNDMAVRLQDGNAPLPQLFSATLDTIMTTFKMGADVFGTKTIAQYSQEIDQKLKRVSELAGQVFDFDKINAGFQMQMADMASSLNPEGLAKDVTGAVTGARKKLGIGYDVLNIAIPSLTAFVGGAGASSRIFGQKLEAAAVYADLENDPQTSKWTNGQKVLIAEASGGLAMAGEIVSNSMLPGLGKAATAISKKIIGDAFIQASAKNIVSGRLKDIIKETAGEVGKSLATESLTEMLTQIGQNTIKEAALIAVNHKDITPDLIPSILDGVAEAGTQALYQSLGLVGGMGVISGAGSFIARNYHKTKPTSTSGQISEAPVQTEIKAADTIPTTERTTEQVATSIRDRELYANVSSGDSSNDVRVGTSASSVSASSDRTVFMTKETFIKKVQEVYGDSKIGQAIIDTVNGKEVDTKNLNIDIQAIKDSIIPYLGKQDAPSFFAQEIKDLGIDASAEAKIAKLKLKPDAKVKIVKSDDPTVIDVAKKEGYQAVIWPEGNEVGGVVFDPNAVIKTEEVSTSAPIQDTATPMSEAQARAKVDEMKSAIKEQGDFFTTDRNVLRGRIIDRINKIGFSVEEATSIADAVDALDRASTTSTYILRTLSEIPVKLKNLKNGERGRHEYNPNALTDPSISLETIFISPTATAETVLHEYIHAWHTNAPKEIADEISKTYGFDLSTPFTPSGKRSSKWIKGVETLVDDMMRYFATGVSPTNLLKAAFESLGRFLKTMIDDYNARRMDRYPPNLKSKKFFDDLFSGKFASLDEVRSGEGTGTGEPVQGFTKEEFEEAIHQQNVETLFDQDGWTVDEVSAAIKDGFGHTVPTFVLNSMADKNKEIFNYAKLRAIDEDSIEAGQKYSDKELVDDHGWLPEDLALRNKIGEEIGFKWSEWDKKFVEFAKNNLELIAQVIDRHFKDSPLRSRIVPKWYDGSETSKRQLLRSISRYKEEYRRMFWSGMAREGDPVYRWASGAEADRLDYINSLNEAKDYDQNGSDVTPLSPSTWNEIDGAIREAGQSGSPSFEQMSKDRLLTEILKAQTEIDELTLKYGDLNAENKKAQSALNKIRAQKERKLKALISGRKLINEANERLSKLSGNGINAYFAEVIDFLANHSQKYMSSVDRSAYPKRINEMEALVEKHNLGVKRTQSEDPAVKDRNVGIDMVLIKDILSKDPDAMTISDINVLIEAKSALSKAGFEFDQARRQEIIDEADAYQRRIIRQGIENGQVRVSNEAMAEIFKRQVFRELVSRGVPIEAVAMFIGESEDPKHIMTKVKEFNANVKNEMSVALDQFIGDEKTRKDRKASFIKDYLDRSGVDKSNAEAYKAAKEEAQAAFQKDFKDQKVEFQKKFMRENGIVMLTPEESRKVLNNIDMGVYEFIGESERLDPNSKRTAILTSGGEHKWPVLSFNTIRRLGMDPTRVLEILDGRVLDGALKQLYYGKFRGMDGVEGWEARALREDFHTQKEFLEKVKSLGFSVESLADNAIAVDENGNVMDPKQAKKAMKQVEKFRDGKVEKAPMFYAYTVEQVMQIYASQFSEQSLDAVTFGVKIPVHIQDKLIGQLTEQQKELANYIMSKYAERYMEFRQAIELHTGKKMGKASGKYSTMVRMFDEYDREVDEGAFAGQPAMNQGRAKDRITINPMHQRAIDLSMVTTYLGMMKDSSRIIHGMKHTDVIKRAMAFGSRLSPKDQVIRDQLVMAFGQNNYKYLYNLYGDIVTQNPARNSMMNNNALSRAIISGTRNIGISFLGLVPRIVATQFFVYFQAVPMFRNPALAAISIPVQMARYFVDSVTGGKLMDQMYERAPMLYERSFDPTERRLREFEKSKFIRISNKIGDFAMFLQRWVDRVSVAAIHEARMRDELSYERTALIREAKGKLDTMQITREEYDSIVSGSKDLVAQSEVIRNKAVNAGTELISKTQPNADMISTPELFKRHPEVAALFFQFAQSMQKVYNQLTHDSAIHGKTILSKRATIRARADAAMRLTLIYGGFALSSYIAFFMRFGRPPEDDEEMKKVALDATSSLGLLGRGVGMVNASFFDGEYYRAPFQPAVIDYFSRTQKAISTAVSDQSGNNLMMAVVTPVSIAFPTPVNEMKNLIEASHELDNGDIQGALVKAFGTK